MFDNIDRLEQLLVNESELDSPLDVDVDVECELFGQADLNLRCCQQFTNICLCVEDTMDHEEPEQHTATFDILHSLVVPHAEQHFPDLIQERSLHKSAPLCCIVFVDVLQDIVRKLFREVVQCR